jgi:hypothetical protein
MIRAPRVRSIPLALVVLALFVGGPAAPAVLAAPDEWGTPSAVATYGKGIEFRQPAQLPPDTVRLEILIDFPGAAGPFVGQVSLQPFEKYTLSWTVDATSGGLLPNTRVGARWRATRADGTVDVGPQVTATYTDTRFDWRTKTGPIVRIHWYEGGDAAAQRALETGEKAIEKASALLGVTVTEPIDFFVYANEADFSDVLGTTAREWVGGLADPDIRTLFMWDENDPAYFQTTVAHELTHVVFAAAVENPYHAPPHWLDEGSAVYLTEGYTPGYRRKVESAARDKRLMPLAAIAGQFPTTSDRASLAYGESVSAVSHIMDTYGQDALVNLIRAYASGISDDEAFRAGLGVTVREFEDSWLTSVGASKPTRVGPVPAPAGPVPSAWAAGGLIASTPAPGVTPGSVAATVTPVASSVSPSAAATRAPGTGTGTADDGGRTLEMLLVGLAAVLAVVGGGWLALRRRPRRESPQVRPTGDAPPPPLVAEPLTAETPASPEAPTADSVAAATPTVELETPEAAAPETPPGPGVS